MKDDRSASKRRDRTKREPTGKNVRLNNRDFEILSLLYRYTLLDSKTLIAFIKPKNQKRFIERLSDLYHDGYLIDRPSQQWQSYRARYSPITYNLTSKGYNLTLERQFLPLRAILTNHERIETPNFQFQHALKINQAIAQTELVCLQTPVLRFVPLEEILNKRREKQPTASNALGLPVTIPRSRSNPGLAIKTEIIPDGLYGIEYEMEGRKKYRFFTLEVEHKSPLTRRTLSQPSSLKKFLSYQAAINSQSFKATLGIPNLFPVFVANDGTHLQNLDILADNVLSKTERKLFNIIKL